MIKAVFFDVDGTLLSHKTKQVSRSTRAAIARLKEKGIPRVVATGRQVGEMEKLPVADIAFDGYITLNGQLVLDGDKQVLHAVPITGKAKAFLLEKFRNQTLPLLLVGKDWVCLNYVTDHVRAVQNAISSPVPPLGAYSGGEIYQVCAYLKEEEQHLLEPIAEECATTRWNLGGWDIIAKGGGKVPGIRKYLELYNLAPDEIMAFGDGENDLEMLRFAGIGVAMGNADDKVKENADYVTADVDDDGIWKALEHFGLI